MSTCNHILKPRQQLIPIEDDYSRKIIAWDMRPEETAFSLSDIIELRIENAQKERHLIDRNAMPDLYTDNGSGFTSKLMADYLYLLWYKTYLWDSLSPSGQR